AVFVSAVRDDVHRRAVVVEGPRSRTRDGRRGRRLARVETAGLILEQGRMEAIEMKLLARLRQGAVLFALWLAAICVHAPAWGQNQNADMKRWIAILQEVEKAKTPLLLVGDLAGYVEAFRAAAKSGDWVSQFIAGNLV